MTFVYLNISFYMEYLHLNKTSSDLQLILSIFIKLEIILLVNIYIIFLILVYINSLLKIKD